LCIYLITPEERPKVYFPSYLETKNAASEAHILSSFSASFQRLSLKFGENVARQYFASFNSYDYFSEGNTCFINSQSLPVCQKQTRQVIKISRHGFLEKGVKKT